MLGLHVTAAQVSHLAANASKHCLSLTKDCKEISTSVLLRWLCVAPHNKLKSLIACFDVHNWRLYSMFFLIWSLAEASLLCSHSGSLLSLWLIGINFTCCFCTQATGSQGTCSDRFGAVSLIWLDHSLLSVKLIQCNGWMDSSEGLSLYIFFNVVKEYDLSN